MNNYVLNAFKPAQYGPYITESPASSVSFRINKLLKIHPSIHIVEKRHQCCQADSALLYSFIGELKLLPSRNSW